MSNDLLKMHLSAVYDRADKKILDGREKNKSKGSKVEKSASKQIGKVKKGKIESNYLDDARAAIAKKAEINEKLKNALAASAHKTSKSFSRKGLKKILKVQRGF